MFSSTPNNPPISTSNPLKSSPPNLRIAILITPNLIPKSLPKKLSFIQASAFSPISYPHKERVDARESYTLDSIRHFLIRQEDSIIFSLLERAQYCYNADTYGHHAFSKDGFHGSLVEFMVKETEKLHAQMGRYDSPKEHPFFPAQLPKPMLPPLKYPQHAFS
ncbi:Chorismate mutase 1, chloroplastic [Vitis vinifera]|uniref:chorismate mutase n=1 Tax=Vitis vinifera TaxID=29760 RepID=A0A438C9F0_VITVI|nr:Chorismate mutase 1, chloroplastic [Vitis vinifera]